MSSKEKSEMIEFVAAASRPAHVRVRSWDQLVEGESSPDDAMAAFGRLVRQMQGSNPGAKLVNGGGSEESFRIRAPESEWPKFYGRREVHHFIKLAFDHRRRRER